MPWSEPVALLAAGFAAVAVSALGTWAAIAYARTRGLYDQPGERRSHTTSTARGGGIGIVVAALIACVFLAVRSGDSASWGLIGLGLFAVAAAGWWDDHRPLSPWPRLGVHALSALALAFALHLQGAGAAACIAAFVLALCLVNAWNFMDGIDGLAASQALLCGLALAWVLAPDGRLLGVVLAGACLGFLPFNFPRARVFMGDVGSGALGYLVAVLLACGFASQSPVSWPLLLLAPMAMLADTGLTLCWRFRRGERWWQAHVDHAFQRWSFHRGHALVTLAYGFWTILSLGFMLMLHRRGGAAGLACFIAWAAVSAIAWRWLHRRYDSRTEGFGA